MRKLNYTQIMTTANELRHLSTRCSCSSSSSSSNDVINDQGLSILNG